MKRHEELYRNIIQSDDRAKMEMLGGIFLSLMDQIEGLNPRLYKEMVEMMEATEWNNYLTEYEAAKIASSLVNQDGSIGAHWPYDVFRGAVESLGGKVADMPYYNCYALWVVANMLYSDHAQSVAEDLGYKTPAEVPNEKMALSMYKKAVEKLKDADRPYFVRQYFHV
jgi:hypothetical protein